MDSNALLINYFIDLSGLTAILRKKKKEKRKKKEKSQVRIK